MADHVAITAGSGTSIATDDVGGNHYQRVKIAYGADGSATDTTSSAPFPVLQGPPNGSIAVAAVSVTTSATALPTSALSNRRRIRVQNLGSVNVFLGPSGVTSSSGIQVSPLGDTEFELGPSVTLYGITASSTADVRVFEQA